MTYIINFLTEYKIAILSVTLVCLITFALIRYIKLLSLFKYCRKLSKLYGGKLKKFHPLFLRVIFNFKTPDIKISFNNKDLFIKFIRVKSKTTVRFTSESSIEKIRYKKAIVPSPHNKGLTPSYVANYSQGSEISAKSSKMNFMFDAPDESIKLILFTENVSEIRVFDMSKVNDSIIGDGEQAYGYYVGGRKFLKKWINRNN